MHEFFANFVHEFKYEIRTNLHEFVLIFSHENWLCYEWPVLYFLVFNMKILKNILKMKYSSINPLSIGHNILSWKLITAL